MRSIAAAVLAGAALMASAPAARAQSAPDGYISLFGDYFPNQYDTTELRARVFVEQIIDPSPRIVITASGFAEGLLARRPVFEAAPSTTTEAVTDGIARVQDLNVQITRGRTDVLLGYARIAWGKLDEIQPSDVINPLDVSRFFFEGRNEARLPTLLARARIHVSDDLTVEGVYVPDFRRGRFDQLEEATSPFNLPLTVAQDPVACLAIGCPQPAAIDDRQPPFTASHAQGGARVSLTTGRVDWSVSAFRGFESFGMYTADRIPDVQPAPLAIARVYPRFTMISGDFEAVRGAWGLRGEVAAFVDDNFQSPDLRAITGTSIEAGVGVDRRAGDYTVSGTVLVHSESYDTALSLRDASNGRSDVSFVASADRTFARERYRLRAFGVYNATEASGFVRAIAIASLEDNLALEGSIGWFAGDGRDLVGRFGNSDFLYLRVKYHF